MGLKNSNMNINANTIKKYRKLPGINIALKPWQLLCLARRRYQIGQYFKSHSVRKLQIGSGRNIIDGWLNTDIIPLDTKIVFLDITHRFPFENNTFDYIFSEHLIEHLSYEKACSILQECYRVLMPGGIIRIATPDIYFLIDLFKQEKTDIQENYIRWSIDTYISQTNTYSETFVVNNFFRDWGHQFIYDFDLLKKTLENVGFVNIVRYLPKESNNGVLKGLEIHEGILEDYGAMMPKEFNNLETMVLEGEKRGKK